MTMLVLSPSQWSMLQDVANGKVIPGRAGKTMGRLAYPASKARGYWMPFTEHDYEDWLVLRCAQLVTEWGELTGTGARWVASQ